MTAAAVGSAAAWSLADPCRPTDPPSQGLVHAVTGTVEMLLAGAPSMILRLMATYTKVFRFASQSLMIFVSLKNSEVSSENTVSLVGIVSGSAIGPV